MIEEFIRWLGTTTAKWTVALGGVFVIASVIGNILQRINERKMIKQNQKIIEQNSHKIDLLKRIDRNTRKGQHSRFDP